MEFSDLLKPDYIAVWGSVLAGLGYWMFKMERNTSSTATSNRFIKEALESLTNENRLEHEKLHGRINEVDARVDFHSIEIVRLQGHNENGGLCSDGSK